MKWGVRKNKSSTSSLEGSKKQHSRKDLRKQRKQIIKDYYDTEKKIYYKQLSKTGDTTSKYSEAHKAIVKKYGKTKVEDALKYDNRKAKVTVAALGTVTLGTLAYARKHKI